MGTGNPAEKTGHLPEEQGIGMREVIVTVGLLRRALSNGKAGHEAGNEEPHETSGEGNKAKDTPDGPEVGHELMVTGDRAAGICPPSTRRPESLEGINLIFVGYPDDSLSLAARRHKADRVVNHTNIRKFIDMYLNSTPHKGVVVVNWTPEMAAAIREIRSTRGRDGLQFVIYAEQADADGVQQLINEGHVAAAVKKTSAPTSCQELIDAVLKLQAR